IDLGIVITDSERSLDFYCGILGLEHVADMPMPIAGGGTMHRIQCGNSVLKLVNLTTTPQTGAGGGPGGATGLRYLTITVSNLHETVEAARAAGVSVPLAPTVVREGVTITMLEDPDGNWVELLQQDG
ncbi:MAG: VOC family protein, partial [Actinomycetota bacterium]